MSSRTASATNPRRRTAAPDGLAASHELAAFMAHLTVTLQCDRLRSYRDFRDHVVFLQNGRRSDLLTQEDRR